MKKITCLDLFCGAGGLTEGFLQTGRFKFLGHVEWEKPMVDTLRNRLVKHWKYSNKKALEDVVLFDIQKTEELLYGNWSEETIQQFGEYNSKVVAQYGLDGIVGDNKIDVIIGGPPCQAYSIAGRAQDPNSMKNDYRNYLFESFVKVVAHYKPEVFVFENVPGMLTACPGDILVIERIFKAFEDIGYVIRNPHYMKKSVYCTSEFSVPQKRNRVIIFGVKKGGKYDVENFYWALERQKKKDKVITVRDAIGELPKFVPLDKTYKDGNKNVSHKLVGDNNVLQHIARYHNPRDIEIFKEWVSNNLNNLSTQEKLEYYKKVSGKTSNHNKYRSLEWDKPSPTIVSHLHKDGLMFIHPDAEQARSITIREAALLQSFPMDYEFIGSSAYCYKMIGNAVPVEFAKSIANSIFDVLKGK